MSAQVDVLAVLDEYIEAFGILRGADELREARAAVAALIAERDALLSIIDNAGKVASVGPVVWQRRYAHQLPAGGMCAWHEITRDEYEAAVSAEYPDRTYEYRALYTAPHQPAPVVDDAMRELIEAAKRVCAAWNSGNPPELKRIGEREYHSPAGSMLDATEIAPLYAALARAQGVQS